MSNGDCPKHLKRLLTFYVGQKTSGFGF